MFTGLIQRIGTVKRVSRGAGLVLEIAADEPWAKPLGEGESVAVNGVCLTVVRCDGSRFTADVLRETESRTGLGELVPGAKVNLERALRAGDAMGGHIVQGHVDATAEVVAVEPAGRDVRMRLACAGAEARYVVYKGSVALDGVSLTVSAVPAPGLFEVNLIPTTLAATSLRERRPGDRVNLETDVLGRYVEALLAAPAAKPVTMDLLRRAGFAERT